MNEKNTRAVAKNYLYSLSYQILLLILPVVTAPYLARVLDQRDLGTFDYAQSIISYFTLFGCIGISLYGQREIAYVKHDPVRRSRVFRELVILRVFTLGAAFAALYFGVIRNSREPLLFAVLSAELLAAAFDISWFYQGMDNFRVQTLRNFAVKAVFVFLVFFFVKTREDFIPYAVSYTAVNLAGNLFTWLGLKKYLVRVPLSSLRLWRHVGPALLLFLPQIATSVYTQLDKTMLGVLLDDENRAVAVYSYSEKIVKLALTVITSLNLVMLSRVAGYEAEGDSGRAVEAVKKSFRFSMALAFPIACGLAAVTPLFVPWFYGEGWEGCIRVMMILSPIVVFIGASGVFGVQYLLPAKRMKAYTLSVFTGTFSNLILNLILIPRFHATGAAIATVAAECLVLLVQILFVRKEFGFRLFLSIWRYPVAGAVMGGAVYAAGNWIQRRMGGTLLQVLFGIALYALLLFVLRDPMFLHLLRRLSGRDKE